MFYPFQKEGWLKRTTSSVYSKVTSKGDIKRLIHGTTFHYIFDLIIKIRFYKFNILFIFIEITIKLKIPINK
jgi:hypothetical protein